VTAPFGAAGVSVAASSENGGFVLSLLCQDDVVRHYVIRHAPNGRFDVRGVCCWLLALFVWLGCCGCGAGGC
jgi:hypothetical protein